MNVFDDFNFFSKDLIVKMISNKTFDKLNFAIFFNKNTNFTHRLLKN